MTVLGTILSLLIQTYLLILVGRVIVDIVVITARDWRPSGVLLVIINLIYKLTDPPLRLLARYIPPLRLGGISLDIGFLILFFGLQILNSIIIRVF
ncbi:YggT family protein [Actinobaculum suis]|uniref:YGGT family n=1 Tax=Actinobaculum suis TaxID=1657 RepID=A0A0K9EUI4_9ACTO|nr:YggT family protein [Actinobaculum suis]KMY23813.1 membrane protein [Actinobaculum suis]MDY5153873.1 YggT family protein [Actinobaculum suis]OCA93304.1 hypothetical protein ACU20_01995 [Actinobaculum suis]OCA94457.1 hypothetical protein ACU21_07070 [Actinobaculum suis]SDD99833.1 YggT family protein [Actinobaculum suis]